MYRRRYLEAVLDAASRADHLVVTGDVTNLALEGEYREACRLFDRRSGTAEISIVPGNHDLYLPSIGREGRFERHFGSFVRSDLPELGVDVAGGCLPVRQAARTGRHHRAVERRSAASVHRRRLPGSWPTPGLGSDPRAPGGGETGPGHPGPPSTGRLAEPPSPTARRTGRRRFPPARPGHAEPWARALWTSPRSRALPLRCSRRRLRERGSARSSGRLDSRRVQPLRARRRRCRGHGGACGRCGHRRAAPDRGRDAAGVHMNYRRVLLLADLEAGAGTAIDVIRRVAPMLDLLLIVARFPASGIAWFSAQAPADLNVAATESLDALRSAARSAAGSVEIRVEPDIDAQRSRRHRRSSRDRPARHPLPAGDRRGAQAAIAGRALGRGRHGRQRSDREHPLRRLSASARGVRSGDSSATTRRPTFASPRSSTASSPTSRRSCRSPESRLAWNRSPVRRRGSSTSSWWPVCQPPSWRRGSGGRRSSSFLRSRAVGRRAGRHGRGGRGR